ncbi:hypothetical protein [Synechococcus sp. CC9616]|uniref:hypothetical protein n=1 Tax=Synechococcus sp. CC9616 TaxID=110663 RepID=UPI0012EB893F|nr:hypothetical protein [Synechococcus sp. CC9616]
MIVKLFHFNIAAAFSNAFNELAAHKNNQQESRRLLALSLKNSQKINKMQTKNVCCVAANAIASTQSATTNETPSRIHCLSNNLHNAA